MARQRNYYEIYHRYRITLNKNTMSTRELESFKNALKNKKNISFIKVKQFIKVGPYDRREFWFPRNIFVSEDNKTVSFTVEEWSSFSDITIDIDYKDIELFRI